MVTNGGLGIAARAGVLGGLLLVLFVVFGDRLEEHRSGAERPAWAARITVDARPPTPETLSRIASAVAGRPVRVTCSGAWGGRAWIERGVATIGTLHCTDLGHLRDGLAPVALKCLRAAAYPCAGTVNQAAIALHVLAHESVHLQGIRDEPQADCFAIQWVRTVAHHLGVPADVTRSLARHHWEVYGSAPLHGYGSPHCRSGGRYDLFPDDPVWP